jgi:1-aminocyclopropane-1-carboxylate deaminase/D-cysteine desulfhydrase-like pyridoxal-dependent ACC family enzyme
MTQSVFPVIGFDRSISKWESALGLLTPFENRNGLWVKREDAFAPLGAGGPNGSKLRQLIHYMDRRRAGKTHVLSGASIQSPQLLMSAIVGAHYGLPTRLVVYSKPHTVLKHSSPRIAAGFGAVYEYASGPYNPIIQRRVADLRRDDSLVVEYGITVDHNTNPADEVRKFHEVGAHQVSNLPEDVRTLYMPAGSCNSLTSLLLGLSRDSKNLRELRTIGIGPDKRDWTRARLKVMGVDIERLPFKWTHHSLHDTGYSKYSDHFKGEQIDGIALHPVYEAKAWRYLRQNAPLKMDGSEAFWIVGSAPDPRAIEPYFTHKLEN